LVKRILISDFYSKSKIQNRYQLAAGIIYIISYKCGTHGASRVASNQGATLFLLAHRMLSDEKGLKRGKSWM